MDLTWMYVWFAFLFGFAIIYWIFIMPYLKRRAANQSEQIMAEVEGEEDKVKLRLLTDQNYLKPITDVVGSYNINGLVNCMERRSVKDVLKDGAINAAGSLAGKAFGVKMEKSNNTEKYYFAVEPFYMHYMEFNYEGKLTEHIKYDRKKVKQLILSKAKFSDNYTGGQSGTRRLEFNYEGEPQRFFLYQGFMQFPTGEIKIGFSVDKEMTYVNKLYSEPLWEILN